MRSRDSRVYGCRNCSPPLYHPSVCRSSRDSPLWLQSTSIHWQDIANRLPIVNCHHYSAMSRLPPPIMPEVFTKWTLLLISLFSQTGRDSLCICTCTCRQCSVKCFGDPPPARILHSSALPSGCWAPVPSVIHEPSAPASAVSDVCQLGPHLSPLFNF